MVEVDLKALLDPRTLIGGGLKLVERFGDEAYFAAVCLRSGWSGPSCPTRSRRCCWPSSATGSWPARSPSAPSATATASPSATSAATSPTRSSTSAPTPWPTRGGTRGLEPGDGVAILVRNHRGFLEAVFAAAKCGAKIILLNTSFAGPQIREVAEREGTDLLVYDDEYSSTLEGVDPPHGRWRAWVEDEAEHPETVDDSLESLIDGGDTSTPPRPGRAPKIVILTSGTTGTPKGAPRDEPRSLGILGGLLEQGPVPGPGDDRAGRADVPRAGLRQHGAGLALGSTLVVRRHFDPEATLDSLEEQQGHRARRGAGDAPAHPRELGEDAAPRATRRTCKVIFVSGSELSVDLVKRSLKAFGPVVYNLYGSTEIAFATIATPEGPRRGTRPRVGRWSRASKVKILDDNGEEVHAGRGRPDLRRQHLPVRGLHRRRPQADHRRADVLGRRRLFRRDGLLYVTAATTR